MLKLDSALGIQIQKDCLTLASVSRGLQGVTVENCSRLENYREFSSSELNASIRELDQPLEVTGGFGYNPRVLKRLGSFGAVEGGAATTLHAA